MFGVIYTVSCACLINQGVQRLIVAIANRRKRLVCYNEIIELLL